MSRDHDGRPLRVVIVGGGFAGVGCARSSRSTTTSVTLLDRNNYHQFQPLLYQVATAQLASTDIARLAARLFRDDAQRRRQAGRGRRRSTRRPARSRRPTARRSRATTSFSRPARSRTSSAPRAPRSTRSRSTRSTTRSALRSRIFGVFEEADRDPSLIDAGRAELRRRRRRADRRGAAGALADLIHDTMTVEYHDLAVTAAHPPRRPRPRRARRRSPRTPTTTSPRCSAARACSSSSASRSRRSRRTT